MTKKITNPHKALEQAKEINATQDLADELGTFRLAVIHHDYDLKSQAANVITANLKIKFRTRAGVEVAHVIPILVTHGDDEETKTYYSGGDVTEAEFLKFYQTIIPSVKAIDRKSHYHSEPFLVYYLCSKSGKRFLVDEFAKKGLIKLGADGEHYESNVDCVLALSIDLHSTKVVCFSCSPFLQAAQVPILKTINWALVLPAPKKMKAITFNVSATTSFNAHNITGMKDFPHTPVLEEEPSLVTRTKDAIGDKESDFQLVGELQRTFFLSGSKSLDDETHELIATDQATWAQVKEDAAIKIQNAWKKYKSRKTESEELAAQLKDKAVIKEPKATQVDPAKAMAKKK